MFAKSSYAVLGERERERERFSGGECRKHDLVLIAFSLDHKSQSMSVLP